VVDWSQFDPVWMDKEFNKGGARDDLGIETLSESILADLLPGINNQTRRARYYSFCAWALYRFIHDPNVKPHTQAKFWGWLRSREDILLLAYMSHNCRGGLAGSEQAALVWENGSKKVYPLTWKSLLSNEGAAYQQLYRGALGEMNIIVQNDNSLHDDLSQNIGIGLAEAYGKAISQTRYAKQFFNATELLRSDIDEFAKAGCVCQIREHDTERRLLIDAFFRFDTPDVFAVKRVASLCFFLDVIYQSEEGDLSDNDFRTTMYFWSYDKHHLYTPKSNLLLPAQRWRNFQLRQFFVYFIESFWSLFLFHIQGEALSAPEYIKWLSKNLDLKYLSREWGIQFLQKDISKISMKEFYLAVQAAVPKRAWGDGSVAIACKLNEEALRLVIHNIRFSPEVNKTAGSALVALALLYWRCQSWVGSPGWHYQSDTYALGRLPLHDHLRRVERAFAENWSLIEWIYQLHQNDLWLQHRKVALEKLVSRGQEVYKFEQMIDESDSPIADFQPKYRGIGLDTPKMNGPRFPSALNILLDLSVIEYKNNRYRLMSDGKRLLEKFRTYKVPQWQEPQDVQITDITEAN
jgi:hypothetical protein